MHKTSIYVPKLSVPQATMITTKASKGIAVRLQCGFERKEARSACTVMNATVSRIPTTRHGSVFIAIDP